MNDAIKGIPPLGNGSTSDNRLARIERALNRIIKFIGNMEDGFGIQFKPTNDMSSIRISAEGSGGGGGGGYVYDGEFAISRTASIKLGGEGESDKEAFFVNGGTVCVNGTRFTLQRKQVAINSNSGFIYLVLKDVEECGEHNWEVDFSDDYSDAIAYIQLGYYSRVQAGETNEHGNPVTPGTYSVVQTYLGGSGANMVVIEDCYS